MKDTKKDKPRRRKVLKIVILSLIGLIILFRLLLPHIVLKYVNRQLAQMDEYYGHVEDIDIALIRGAYVINDIRLDKINKKKNQTDSIPFFKCPEIDLSVQWKAIFKGSIVGEIYVKDPVLNFTKEKQKDEDLKDDTADFRELVDDLMPLTINHFNISDGEVHYIDRYSSPKIDVFIERLYVEASNLSNVNKEKKLLPAHIEATGYAYDGKFSMKTDLDALAKVPTFDMNATVTDVNLVKLNDFLKAYGNFDVKKGNFGLYTEFAAKNGKFSGYVKPFLRDLDVVQWNKEEGNFVQVLWETLVGTGAEIFQNQRKEQLATKVPVEGRFTNPDVETWDAIVYVLRNAFVNALKPSIDNSINIANVGKKKDDKRTIFERIVGENDNPDEKETRKEKRKRKRKEKKDTV